MKRKIRKINNHELEKVLEPEHVFVCKLRLKICIKNDDDKNNQNQQSLLGQGHLLFNMFL